jgi:hypothetical protein
LHAYDERLFPRQRQHQNAASSMTAITWSFRALRIVLSLSQT